MTAADDPADRAPAGPDEPTEAQFGPHRFYAGEGGGSGQFRGARFDVADLRGARFTDCDMTGVTIRDCWLVNVDISGYLSNVTVNGVDVTDFVSAVWPSRNCTRSGCRRSRRPMTSARCGTPSSGCGRRQSSEPGGSPRRR